MGSLGERPAVFQSRRESQRLSGQAVPTEFQIDLTRENRSMFAFTWICDTPSAGLKGSLLNIGQVSPRASQVSHRRSSPRIHAD